MSTVDLHYDGELYDLLGISENSQNGRFGMDLRLKDGSLRARIPLRTGFEAHTTECEIRGLSSRLLTAEAL